MRIDGVPLRKWLLHFIPLRLRLAYHVLRGRPTMYKIDLAGSPGGMAIVHVRDHTFMADCIVSYARVVVTKPG